MALRNTKFVHTNPPGPVMKSSCVVDRSLKMAIFSNKCFKCVQQLSCVTILTSEARSSSCKQRVSKASEDANQIILQCNASIRLKDINFAKVFPCMLYSLYVCEEKDLNTEGGQFVFSVQIPLSDRSPRPVLLNLCDTTIHIQALRQNDLLMIHTIIRRKANLALKIMSRS